MKTIMILILTLSLLLGGCATVQQAVCNPPQSVINVVVAAVPLIEVAVEMACPGSKAYMDAIGAQAIAGYILSGACVTAEQLTKLITWLQSYNKSAKMKAVDNSAIQVLIDWRDGK